jgi:hypothetical protein
MSVLTSSATLAIADGAYEYESVIVTVLPAAMDGTGTGRLTHPSLGSYDYERPPDEWTNMRGDAVIAPIWATTKTLLGAANTLFAGDLRDVIVEERWTQSIVWKSSMVDMLLSMWTTPPDPTVAFVQWFPSYANDLGFNVVMIGMTLGGRDITTTSLSHGGYDRGPLTLRMRIVSRV